MYSKIELWEPLHDHLKVKNKRGRVNKFVYVVCIGPVVKICPSENSAHRYLVKMGFEMTEDATQYELKYRSEGLINLDKLYRKALNL